MTETRNEPVPLHLRNAPTALMKGLGYGRDYKYAHDYEDAQVEQEHFPPNLRGRRYYEPTGRGFEVTVRERLAWRDARVSHASAKGGHKEENTGSATAQSTTPSAIDPQALAGEEPQIPADDMAETPQLPRTPSRRRSK